MTGLAPQAVAAVAAFARPAARVRRVSAVVLLAVLAHACTASRGHHDEAATCSGGAPCGLAGERACASAGCTGTAGSEALRECTRGTESLAGPVFVSSWEGADHIITPTASGYAASGPAATVRRVASART